VFKQSALTITAIAGHHGDAPSVIYRVDAGGRSVTFSAVLQPVLVKRDDENSRGWGN
jgi:hypothetical protein